MNIAMLRSKCYPPRSSYPAILLSLLALLCGLASAQQYGTRTYPSTKGIYIYWDRTPDVTYSIYRGESPDEMKLIAADVELPPLPTSSPTRYLDTTARSGTKYFYKVVAESRSPELTLIIPEKLIFVRDWRTREMLAQPENSSEQYAPTEIVQPNPAEIYGKLIRPYNNQIATYKRYLSNIVPGRKYTARITFGSISQASGGGGHLRISLSPRSPVADVVVNSSGASAYANKTIDFNLLGGPAGWNEFYIEVRSNTSSQFAISIKRIELFESPNTQ